MKQIFAITRKELEGYFGTPLAVIFLGTFLAVVLFVFFSVETFFSRGIADVRPLFQWMPILLIFLLGALTMRQWSEEQRSGTMEILTTLPVKPIQLVLGKFFAVMSLIVLALVLTLPLPITVAQLGNLDWGPVIGGYIAALLMASAYAAIGLFVSSRTDNQIVALIITIIVGGLFYFVGTQTVTDLFAGKISDILWAIGTGSRFESIERGVIDIRDLIYYLSITGFFLMLNTLSLDMIRWSRHQKTYQRMQIITALLLTLNLVALNIWMYPMYGLRVDLTSQKEYTISQTTKDLLANLEEPLLIRAYISENNHPQLLPLEPQIEDMIREYEIASEGMITGEVVDPITDPELEAEANQTYGITTTPFQISGRYEASVVNAYFDILIRYADQSVVLNYSDIIEIQSTSDGIQVSLKNFEYDLTRAIKKVVYGFQSVDSVLAALSEPVVLNYYVTPDLLPEELLANDEIVRSVAEQIAADSNGNLIFNVIDPGTEENASLPQQLYDEYAVQPFSVSFYSNETFYMHLVLQTSEDFQVLYPLGEEITEADIRNEIESAIKRTSSGFLKVVGFWSKDLSPTTNAYGQTVQAISSYSMAQGQLSGEYQLQGVDLSTGQVSSDIDVLILMSPVSMTDVELYAVDQYLMRGGAVIIANSSYEVNTDPYAGGLGLFAVDSGLNDMLAHYGINMGTQVVQDANNENFPVMVTRDVNGYQIQEIQAIEYPFFVDVLPQNMNTENPILSNLPTITMDWVVPVELDEEINADREAEVLMYSSENSWLSDSVNIQPNFDMYPELGFAVGSDQQSYPLAVSVKGSFDSYFADKPNPIIEAQQAAEAAEEGIAEEGPAAVEDQLNTTIETSPDSARLVVFGSNTFVDDFVLELSARLSAERYLSNLQLLQNSVDWCAEDLELLAIRSRGTYTRVLNSLEPNDQRFWEILNYAIAIILLAAIYITWQIDKRNEKPIPLIRNDENKKDGDVS